MTKKLILTIELACEEALFSGDDLHSVAWIEREVFSKPLILHSNGIGSDVGIAKVLSWMVADENETLDEM